MNWVGPFQGTSAWKQVAQRFRVPPDTREAIIRIGLFGATGEISFDEVQMKSTTRPDNPTATSRP